MGIFGSSRVHITDSYTSPLLVNSDLYDLYDSGKRGGPDKPWPSLVRQTVAASIVGNRNIATDLTTNLVNGVYAKARSMYNYGKLGETTDGVQGFTRGLPTGDTVYIPQGTPNQLKAIISAELISDAAEIALAEERELTALEAAGKILITSTRIDEEDDGNLWYSVDYYLLDLSGNTFGDVVTWRYKVLYEDPFDPEISFHTTLIPKVKAEETISPYFPIVPIREKGRRIKTDDPELYQRGRHTLRTLGIKIEDLDEAIHDSGNTDLDFLDHAYVIVAVDIATKVDNSNLYLYEHFNALYYESGVKEEDFTYWNTHVRKEVDNTDAGASLPPPPPINRLNVSDGKYKMVLGWKYITKTLESGVVTRLGKVVKDYFSVPPSYIGGVTNPNHYTIENAYIRFRKQVTPTEYIEIQVHGLVHTNFIGSSDKEIRTTLTTAFTTDTDDDKNNFVIPLRYDLMQSMGAIKGHDLLYDSVRAVFNSHTTQKLKWYQTGAFKVLVVIVAVAITIFTAGTGVPLLSAAMAGLVATTIVTTVVTMYAIEVGLKMVEDLLGPEVALAVAVITVYLTGDVDSVNTYVSMTTTAVGGINGIITMNALEDIEQELKLLDEEMTELAVEEALRTEDLVWTMNALDDTSYLLTQPNNYLRNVKREKQTEVDLALRTHLFTEAMRFTDKPYSHIKLGLNPNQA